MRLFCVMLLVGGFVMIYETFPTYSTDLVKIDQSPETLSGEGVFGDILTTEGTWEKDATHIQSTDVTANSARAFIPGHEWIDCIYEATIRIDKTGDQPWAGLRLILRGNNETNNFTTVGFYVPQHIVTIEQVTNMEFVTLAQAPFPVELGKSYRVKVITDRAGFYCFIDGKYVIHAVEKKFSTRPSGMVGFYSAAAVGSYSDVSVKPSPRSNSPFKVYPGNPLDIDAYSPSVIRDKDTYKMWFSMGPGQGYAESKDGIHWTRPAGTSPVKPLGKPGEWGDFNEADAEVVKIGDEFRILFPAGSTINDNWWDGVGYFTSNDGIHWTPDKDNPVFYMGPVGSWDENGVGDHSFIKDGDTWKMWFTGINFAERGYRNEFGYAESADGIHWRKSTLNPVITQGDPGEWDGGWLSAASVLKLGDDELQTRVYAGQPGGSYHCFYHGHITNDEFVSGVKRIGWAFSLDGIHFVKYDDALTVEPPFHRSDPIIPWMNWGVWGHEGVRACSAIRDGDEIKIWFSGEGVTYGGTGMATAKIADLEAIVEKAKADGKLEVMPPEEIKATLVEPMPLSTWDDLGGHVLNAALETKEGHSKQSQEAINQARALVQRMNRSEKLYLEKNLSPLGLVVDKLLSGEGAPIVSKVWELDPATLENLPSEQLYGAKCEGLEKGACRFATSGPDPFVILPPVNINVGVEPLHLIQLNLKVEHPTHNMSVHWAKAGEDFIPGIAAVRQIRWPEHQQTLCFVLPWRAGEKIERLRLDFGNAQKAEIRSAIVYSIQIEEK